jgi:acetyl-CoA carboxylase biotin carboxylase subunit
MSNIIAAAEITNADAIHPGYGFLSENSKFSKICQEHGIIGASPEMIDRMGDKASAKATMIEAGCPLFLVQLVFWSHSNKRKSWHDLLVTRNA